MIVTKCAAVFWRRGTVRNLLVGGFSVLSVFSLQSNALAFHDGKDSYINGQGVLWQAVKYKSAKKAEIRSEIDDEKAGKMKEGEKAPAKKKKARAKKREVDMTIYVMGTFHIMLRDVVKLPKEVIEALDRSTLAVFERRGKPISRKLRHKSIFE